MNASSSLQAVLLALGLLTLSGCAVMQPPAEVLPTAQLTPSTRTTRDLTALPPPKGRVAVAVYGFRDQTGQYKASPDSSFSTSVTQGAASILVKALKDSGWFLPLERENLQNLLTERKIVRALETPQDRSAPAAAMLPQLLPASVMIEGGVIAYESNVRTGGAGARYLGVGLSSQYRVDQVTVNLRSVDIRNGQILNSVSTTKTIFSYEVHPSVFKFVAFKDLLELEGGMTRNEPAQLCVKEAIEAAVVHLVVQGVKDQVWAFREEKDWNAPVVQSYLRQSADHAAQLEAAVATSQASPATAPASTH
ncbi:MAG: curli production assembly/transport protein CsgG [Polaromonas sp.]|jgi:curli production assembly/transport component CsgG|nr:curli production assembly/transport protein CsgG [Polaromonas sp.]MDB5845645.1 curli production assembly/transport protein CsgG [Polaromonas sp.]MDB5939382.1 curli production assembly/transport protein CsgG [Polaromonas sp.]